jgi:hypothetical protein
MRSFSVLERASYVTGVSLNLDGGRLKSAVVARRPATHDTHSVLPDAKANEAQSRGCCTWICISKPHRHRHRRLARHRYGVAELLAVEGCNVHLVSRNESAGKRRARKSRPNRCEAHVSSARSVDCRERAEARTRMRNADI